MPIIALVLVVAALLGGYFAFFRNNTTQGENSEPTPIVESTETEVVQAVATTTETSSETTTPPPAAAAPVQVAPAKPTEVVQAPAIPESITESETKSLTSETVTYRTPARSDNQVALTLTLTGSKITDVALNLNNGAGVHNNYQKRFESEYRTQVIGKNIDNISLSRVGGASLTSKAFNDAVATIAR